MPMGLPLIVMLFIAFNLLALTMFILVMVHGHKRSKKPPLPHVKRDVHPLSREPAALNEYRIGDGSRRWRPSGRWDHAAQGEALRA